MVEKEKQNKKKSTRPPVVVVLGHVDHGKSSILEAIRDLKITEKESGGITQHIGAYEVEHPSTSSGQAKKITFIDTPGHEAFSAMRARGAKIADIAILVVDATEGVKPQTKEAIIAVKKAGIPMIVAINKMDKTGADPQKVKNHLSREKVLVESMGGDIPSVEVSAKTGQGIEELLEMISLVADMEELEQDLKSRPEGTIVESFLDHYRGPVATLVLKKGVLKLKDVIATDKTCAKIKNLENFQEKEIKKIYPSQPAVVLGFEKVPQIGEKFKKYESPQKAINKIEKEKSKKERETPSSVFVEEEGQKVLNIILKADVLGSLEAIEEVLKNLPQDKVIVRILKSEVGNINESDLKLARMSNAQIVGFRVKIDSAVGAVIKKKDKKVKIETYDVIYELIQSVREGMHRKIVPKTIREDLGKVKVLVIFRTRKTRQIIGGKVTKGEARKSAKIEVYDGEEKKGEGKIINLQQNKRDVSKLKSGEECGILYEGNVKIQEGDILKIYTEKKEKIKI